ncbi:MAG: hypothetical protein ACRDAP_04970, partial [Shewanella sp.]
TYLFEDIVAIIGIVFEFGQSLIVMKFSAFSNAKTAHFDIQINLLLCVALRLLSMSLSVITLCYLSVLYQVAYSLN